LLANQQAESRAKAETLLNTLHNRPAVISPALNREQLYDMQSKLKTLLYKLQLPAKSTAAPVAQPKRDPLISKAPAPASANPASQVSSEQIPSLSSPKPQPSPPSSPLQIIKPSQQQTTKPAAAEDPDGLNEGNWYCWICEKWLPKTSETTRVAYHVNVTHKSQIPSEMAKQLGLIKCKCGHYCSGQRGLTQHLKSAKCKSIHAQQPAASDEKEDRKERKEAKGDKEAARARRANTAAEGKRDAKAPAPLQPVLAPNTRITSQMIAELGPATDKVHPEIRHRYSKIIAEICRAMLQAARIGDFDMEQRCLMFMVYTNAFLLSRKFGGNRSRARRAQAYEAFEQAQDQAGLKAALQMPQLQQQQQNQAQTTQLDLSIRRAIELLESGFISRATKRMAQKGLANPTDPEVKNKMRALHPQNSNQMPACPANAPEVLLDKAEIALAIRNMAAKGSAAGADKMTAQHLSTLITNESCLQAVTLVCNRIANGKYTGDARELVTDTRGIELLKETGGIRPIAIGQTLTRIAAQRAFERDRAEWIKAAGPHQLGLGKTAGVEASVFVTQNALDQGMAVLSLTSKTRSTESLASKSCAQSTRTLPWRIPGACSTSSTASRLAS
jgi:hypothetical protein